MPSPRGAELVELGRGTQFKNGHPGIGGRPIVDRVARKLAEDKERELRIAELWMTDAEDKDPQVRRDARRDILDRLIGKPSQSVQVTLEELSEVEWGEESP